jgi:outer membrane murein-binding lipoprotein Lpp
MFKRAHAIAILTLLIFTGTTACKSKPTSTPSADPSASVLSAKLTDLSTSLDAVRSAFKAHKQEARFLTLLSPT